MSDNPSNSSQEHHELAAEIAKLMSRMENMQADFAEEQTRIAADTMLAAAEAKDSASEVARTVVRAKERITAWRRKLIVSLLATVCASFITAYAAIYFHEVVRSGCYRVEPIGQEMRDVRLPDAPWYCYAFPGTGAFDSPHGGH